MSLYLATESPIIVSVRMNGARSMGVALRAVGRPSRRMPLVERRPAFTMQTRTDARTLVASSAGAVTGRSVSGPPPYGCGGRRSLVHRVWSVIQMAALTPATPTAMSAIPRLVVNTAKPMISTAAISQVRGVMPRHLCGRLCMAWPNRSANSGSSDRSPRSISVNLRCSASLSMLLLSDWRPSATTYRAARLVASPFDVTGAGGGREPPPADPLFVHGQHPA
ncbi:hypothetical protein ACLQ3H_16180 [Micromonospora saelicesensis]|uniref:hypothetical protein n=1 Tax=Micromonospora saelicesensis TaxID=285676 RepID=UPI003CF4AD02